MGGDICIRSDQISRSVVSDSLRPHESQHARSPCPSPTPGVYPNSCPTGMCCMAQEAQTGNLEGWDGEGDGREFQNGGDICIPMADSC